jgi:hypothetical protein
LKELDAFVSECRRRDGADPDFIGSDDHLDALRAYGAKRMAGITVDWGFASLSEIGPRGPRAEIKHPSLYLRGTGTDPALLSVSYLIHEIHHLLHSDYESLLDFETRTISDQHRTRLDASWVVDLCNQLEDGRLLHQARENDQGDVPALEAVHLEGFEISRRQYAEAHRSSPWGSSPASEDGQLTLALTAFILLDTQEDLSTRNAAVIEAIAPLVVATRGGGSRACVNGAREIAMLLEKLL